MRLTVLFLLTAGAASLMGQTEPPDGAVQDQTSSTAQTKADTPQQQPTEQRSTIEVKPGSPVIKQKDIWNETGLFHPFVRMPRYILQDQKAIWTSPFHTAKSDAKYWAVFGTAVGVLIATDRHTVKVLPNSSSQVSVSTWASRAGSAYSLIPISAGFYLLGGQSHERFRETGLLCFETLIDSNLIGESIKIVADRARPLESNGHGQFEDSPNGRWSSGFPSGHALNSWAMASVVAHQYPHPRIIPIMAYGLATVVVCARVGARQHFPGDVVAGSAMGWFIGDYVYGKRHNEELDRKPTAAQKIIGHVHLGLEIQ
jgi:membrane-associated phospholipid phosphatase